MKEIVEYEKREVLRKHLGAPILTTDTSWTGDPWHVTMGVLKLDQSTDSFWIEGLILEAKEDRKWPKVYRVMGVDYIPNRPRVVHPILDYRRNPNYRIYRFDSDAKGKEIIEKVRRLEDIDEII